MEIKNKKYLTEQEKIYHKQLIEAVELLKIISTKGLYPKELDKINTFLNKLK